MTLSILPSRCVGDFHRLGWVAGEVARRSSRRFQARYFDADDALQYALLGLCEALRIFGQRDRAGLVNFCRAVCLRRCLDGYRAAVGRGGPGGGKRARMHDAVNLEVERGAADPFLERVDLRDECGAALRPFTPRERAAARLYYIDGLTLRQTGRVLGLSESGTCRLFERMRGYARGTHA
jgi:RNA polymerase sigma factor (sigma-70 family)